MDERIKRLVAYYVKKFNTTDPYIIAECLNIKVFIVPLGRLAGYYKYLKHHRCIFINSDIEDNNFRLLVMAHELGHAILHVKENCYFMANNTFFLTSKNEIQANKFAMDLLITDSDLEEFKNYSIEELSCIFGYHSELIELRLK